MSTEQYDSKPSRKGARLLIGIAAGFIVFGILRALLTPAPPVYGGKTIHEWWPEVVHSNGDTNKPVAIALRHMGTNALPKILTELSLPYIPEEDDWLVTWVRKLPSPWQERFPYQMRNYTDSRCSDAEMAFGLLGPERTNALPHLRRLAIEQGSRFAMDCLLLCGSEGPVVVLDQLNSSNRTHILASLRALNYFQPQSRALMLRHVTADEADLVHTAMRPRVTALAAHPDVDIRMAVASVLVNSAVAWGKPIIDGLLTDTNMSATIQEQLKQRAWWESYRATNLPASKPAP